MNDILKRITDTVTIAFPAIIAIFGVLKLAGVVEGLEVAEQIVMIGLGAASAICSIWFNRLSKS